MGEERIYRSSRTRQLMSTQGYAVADYEINETLDDFKARHGGSNIAEYDPYLPLRNGRYMIRTDLIVEHQWLFPVTTSTTPEIGYTCTLPSSGMSVRRL